MEGRTIANSCWITLFCLWTVLAVFVHRASSSHLEIKPIGEKFIRAYGSSIVLSCYAIGTNASDVKIQWSDHRSRPITEGSGHRIYVESGSNKFSKLYITSIQLEDAGKYSCSATIHGVKLQKSVELEYFKDITFDHAPNPQHPAIHCNAVIECKVSGNPEPDVSWRRDGRTLDTTSVGGRYVKEPKGLLIKNISTEDNGIYTCRAEVEADGRYDERTITVIVHIPPVVTRGPEDIEGIEGKKITLSCKASGLPAPKFEFHKENRNKEMKVVSANDRVKVDADAGQLSFDPLKKEDEGKYSCKAVNDVGADFGKGSLKVIVTPKVHVVKNVTAAESETAVLSCKSLGDPAPHITFQKVGNHEEFKNTSNDGGRISVTQKGAGHYELVVRKISTADNGTYICRARNIAGSDMATGFISVRYKPRFTTHLLNHAYTWAGTVHNITCQAHAQPVPTLEWRRHNHPIRPNETYAIFNMGNSSNLQVRMKEGDQTWIYGDYVCHAKNEEGHSDFRINLDKATVPDAPRSVIVNETYPNLILLYIEPPVKTGGVKIVGYRVEYDNKVQDFSISDPKEVETKVHERNRSTNIMRIENLRPGTTYLFRVRAKNDVGAGNLTEKMITTANVTKPFSIQLSSPKISQDATQYTVTWEKPKTGGKPIKEYEIRYKMVRRSRDGNVESLQDWQSLKIKDRADHPRRSHKLVDLVPNSDYQLQVLATNEIGYSKPEGEFFFRTGIDAARVSSGAGSSYGRGHVYLLSSLAALNGFLKLWTRSALIRN